MYGRKKMMTTPRRRDASRNTQECLCEMVLLILSLVMEKGEPRHAGSTKWKRGKEALTDV